MRITLVISSLWGGGAERAMSLLANCWAENGKDVTLLCLDNGQGPGYFVHPQVKLQYLGQRSQSSNFLQAVIRNFRRIRELRRAIRESQPDVVVSFVDVTNILTILATRGLGKPVIVSERTDPSLHDIGPVWSGLRRLVYRFADALVCQTRASVERFQATIKINGYAIPNVVELPPEFVGSARCKPQGPGGHILIAMGRLVSQKGFDLLLNAFAQVADRNRDWSIRILGEGPLRKQLELEASALQLAGRVHFAGLLADPFPALCAADLFVFPSRFEGFGMALAEAMACGLPVVSFDCPEGPAEILRDGIDGVLVPPADVKALAKTLDHLMGDAQARAMLAARGPEVLARFGADRVLQMWQQLFDALLSTNVHDNVG